MSPELAETVTIGKTIDDCGRPVLEVSYSRPLTQKELEEEEAYAAQRAKEQEAEEREYKTWLELNKKFG